MARVSRKAALAEPGINCLAAAPEKIYHAAAYVRLSVEDNGRAGDKESIAMQQYMLEKYIESQPDMKLLAVYCDNGETGTDFDRPGIRKLLALAGKTVDCILVKDFSRFGRNLVEVGDYLDQIFPFLGVRFIAVNEGYDSGKGLGSSVSLDVSLKAFVYEMYSRDVSEKVRSVKQKCGKGNIRVLLRFMGTGCQRKQKINFKLMNLRQKW